MSNLIYLESGSIIVLSLGCIHSSLLFTEISTILICKSIELSMNKKIIFISHLSNSSLLFLCVFQFFDFFSFSVCFPFSSDFRSISRNESSIELN